MVKSGPTSPKASYGAPSREDYFDFLVRCYFGDGTDHLALCVRRAYLDLNRTLHGFARHQAAGKLRDAAHRRVAHTIQALRHVDPTQDAFDAWHRKACSELRALYRRGNFKSFTFGQAQKWLNMTLKYVFAMGEQRLGGYSKYYPFAHVPIDNVFVSAAKSTGGPDLPAPWSRLDDYPAYFGLQQAYRRIFSPGIPLAAEFRLWLGDL